MASCNWLSRTLSAEQASCREPDRVCSLQVTFECPCRSCLALQQQESLFSLPPRPYWDPLSALLVVHEPLPSCPPPTAPFLACLSQQPPRFVLAHLLMPVCASPLVLPAPLHPPP